MDFFAVIVVLIWLVRIGTNLITYIQLWFVKEYRFDRMYIHLGTQQGKLILFPKFRRPPLSLKTMTLFWLSSITLFILLFFLPVRWFVAFFLVDLLTFPVTALWVGLLKLPTLLYHEFLILLATQKLRKYPPKIVIGITGSYGKTTTKEFAATLLQKKFTVLKTEASKNSPIAIAELVLKRLTQEVDVFVVEMGAYRRGEIGRMADMVKPQIGIVTAINPQHQDLFRSIETTVAAKYELIDHLVDKKIAIFNADNTYCKQMAEKAISNHTVLLYSSQSHNSTQVHMYAEKIQTTTQGLEFNAYWNKKHFSVKTNLRGSHQVGNVLAAFSLATAAGMNLKDCIRAAIELEQPAHTLQILKGVHGITIIDDTFNNNPDAALVALEYLKLYKGKKIFVFQPMIELGKFSKEAHKKVGQKAAEICDQIYLTNDNFNDFFASGINSNLYKEKVRTLSTNLILKELRLTADEKNTVLCKGKEAWGVVNGLLR